MEQFNPWQIVRRQELTKAFRHRPEFSGWCTIYQVTGDVTSYRVLHINITGVTLWFKGSLVRWIVGSMDRWFDGLVVQWFIGSMVWWIAGSMDRWFDGSLVRWFDGSLVRWFDGSSVRWIAGSLDRWTDECQNGTFRLTWLAVYPLTCNLQLHKNGVRFSVLSCQYFPSFSNNSDTSN